MAYTLEQLQSIERAIATGVRRVKLADGRDQENRSLAELLAIAAIIRRELFPYDGEIHTQTVHVTKGLD